MKAASAIFLLALALGTSSAEDHVVEFSLSRGSVLRTGLSLPPLARRATLTEDLINNITDTAYFVDVEVGSPGQKVSLLFDTGSSDTWVISYRADLCTDPSVQLTLNSKCLDTYDPAKSSTYSLVQTGGLNISYIAGAGAFGDYFTDDLSIGGAVIKKLQMGYATVVPQAYGIMGLGFSSNVATLSKYPTIMDQLSSQGLITSKAFSLYLNDVRSEGGTILFGGVDQDKFIGPLTVLPIVRSIFTGNFTQFEVMVSALSLRFTNGTKTDLSSPALTASLPAILDSGTTLTYLPNNLALQVFRAVGAETYGVSGLAFVDCELPNLQPELTMNFTFGSATISVPVRDLVLDLLGASASAIPGLPFERSCYFTIQSNAGFQASRRAPNYALIGSNFLRSAYVVYDMDNLQIGIAQANLNSTTSKISELKANGSATGGLSGLTGVAAQQTSSTPTTTATTTTSSSSTTAADGGGGGLSGTGSSENSPTPTVTVVVPGRSAGSTTTGAPPLAAAVVAAWILCFAFAMF